ncbi:hypothetical protein BJ875DRAFT_380845 [Amylocarpus encephaloides]|uniref:Uncharacterized protein n=1 Tax=Amylocarpus encephaloides TaxID=45428 RepID=A0A9P8C3R9_9HELO|nr:hypothetical protein BJ875DRAFT_380845 [Amylocarpus encephaloides]
MEIETSWGILSFKRLLFSAFCKSVIGLCPGSYVIQNLEKKEGGLNRVFIFLMVNGTRTGTRFPSRITGSEMLTTNSEVITMAYIRRHTDIPVPKALEWSDCKANDIGTEYIII